MERVEKLSSHLSTAAPTMAATASTLASPSPSNAMFPLCDGVEIPAVGFGCVGAKESMAEALAVGFVHLDTAAIYKGGQSEKDVGELLREHAGEPIFVTTKVASYGPAANTYMWDPFVDAQQGVQTEFAQCLERLGASTVDLLLLHWPGPPRDGRPDRPNVLTAAQHEKKRLAMWRGLEAIHANGGARAIGVSNFSIAHLTALLPHCGQRPCCNQIELHSQCGQRELVAYCQEQNILPVAYSPISGSDLSAAPLPALAATYDVSPAAVVARWLFQRGVVVITQSKTPARIANNRTMADGWALTEPDMLAITNACMDEAPGGHTSAHAWANIL